MLIISQIGTFAKLSTLVALAPLGVAIACLVRPTERTLVFMRPASLGAVFAAICALANAASMIFEGLAASSQGFGMARVYAGLAEAFAPVFVSFGFLAVAWLLVAAGMLRRFPVE